MNREEVIQRWDSMTARERDAWVSGAVFGWKIEIRPNAPESIYEAPYWVDKNGRVMKPANFFNPTSDISAAWEVIGKMRELGFDYAIESLHDSLNWDGDLVHVRFFKRQEGEYCEFDGEMPVTEAICLAALLAVLTS